MPAVHPGWREFAEKAVKNADAVANPAREPGTSGGSTEEVIACELTGIRVLLGALVQIAGVALDVYAKGKR